MNQNVSSSHEKYIVSFSRWMYENVNYQLHMY
jgi:hypothetical protein